MISSPYQILIQQAESLLDIGRATEAIPLLQEASSLEPNQSEHHRQLTWAFLRLGRKLDAFRSVKRAVELEPESPWSHFALAEFHRMNGSHDAALKAACEAVRLAPDDPVVLQIRCLAELAAGQAVEARRTAERIRELAPDWAMAYTLLGHVSSEEGNNSAAQAHFRKALELDPTSSHGHHDIGLALRKQGRNEEALERLHEAVRLNPLSTSARRDLKQQMYGYLMGWKWALALVVYSGVMYSRNHFFGSFKTGSTLLDFGLQWSPFISGGLVLVVTTCIAWRRQVRMDPALAKIHRTETWQFRKALGKALLLHLLLPVCAWMSLLFPIKWLDASSMPRWVPVLHALVILSSMFLLIWYVNKKFDKFMTEWSKRRD